MFELCSATLRSAGGILYATSRGITALCRKSREIRGKCCQENQGNALKIEAKCLQKERVSGDLNLFVKFRLFIPDF